MIWDETMTVMTDDDEDDTRRGTVQRRVMTMMSATMTVQAVSGMVQTTVPDDQDG